MRRLLWIIDDGLSWMILDDSWMIFDDYCAFSEFYLTRSLCGFNHENHWRIFVTFFVWILGLSPIVGHKKGYGSYGSGNGSSSMPESNTLDTLW